MSIESQGKQRSGVFNDKRVDYRAFVQKFPVKIGDALQGTCSVTSYIAEASPQARTKRPINLLLQRRSGSRLHLLHLGGIGPKRIAIPDDLTQGLMPPYVLEDNPSSCLDIADLVFIDPINTGFGRSVPDAKLDELYSVEGDARCFAQLIRQWLDLHGRWDSAKYVMGESYGTQRAPFLAAALLDLNAGLTPLDGIIVLGQAINVQETMGRPGNVMSAVAAFPFIAATAWYHEIGTKKFDSVESTVEAALEFAFGGYAQALLKGRRISDAERTAMAEELQEWTGIASKTWIASRLVISKDRFKDLALAEKKKVLGIYDSRYCGDVVDPAVAELPYEPSVDRTLPAFTAMAARYFSEILDETESVDYRIIDGSVSQRWDWTDAGSSRFNILGKASPFSVFAYPARLTQYMKRVPTGRLFIGTGMYDGLTTVGAAEHLLRYFDLPMDRITERRYAAGHMMYTDPTSATKLGRDLREFLAAGSER